MLKLLLIILFAGMGFFIINLLFVTPLPSKIPAIASMESADQSLMATSASFIKQPDIKSEIVHTVDEKILTKNIVVEQYKEPTLSGREVAQTLLSDIPCKESFLVFPTSFHQWLDDYQQDCVHQVLDIWSAITAHYDEAKKMGIEPLVLPDSTGYFDVLAGSISEYEKQLGLDPQEISNRRGLKNRFLQFENQSRNVAFESEIKSQMHQINWPVNVVAEDVWCLESQCLWFISHQNPMKNSGALLERKLRGQFTGEFEAVHHLLYQHDGLHKHLIWAGDIDSLVGSV